MAGAAKKTRPGKKKIESYEHREKRANNPPVGLVTAATDPDSGRKTYAYDPHLVGAGKAERIALWMLDTDYEGRSVYPRQFFFPMAGEDEGWARLARNLKAEIDPERIEKYRGTVSLPFEAGEHKRVAIKIVDDRGIESLRVLEIP